METQNYMIENIPHSYIPKHFEEMTYANNPTGIEKKVIDGSDFYIYDYFGIPSSLSLMSADAANPVDL